MRVYGSSPLYNYVELVFRSKKVFIACVILATIATAGFAVLRSKSYNAEALILLSGTPSQSQGDEDKAERGTVKFKLSVLNLVLQDPIFAQTAFREKGLNRGMTEEQFVDFSKEARKALKAGHKDNILELSCKWKNNLADDIIQAFYSAYSRRVLDEETVVSTNETTLLRKLLEEYTAREKALELKVVEYKQSHATDPQFTPEAASSAYAEQERAVNALQNQMITARMQMDAVTRKLKETPESFEEVREYGSPKQDPAYAAKIARQQELQSKLAELKLKYNDNHPLVKNAQTLLDDVNAELAKKDTANSKKPVTKGDVMRTKVTKNPEYQNLTARKNELEINMSALQRNLSDAQSRLAKLLGKSKGSAKDAFDYKWMTSGLDLTSSIRGNLSAKLESAIMAEKRDKELRRQEMKMVVEPKAEPEVAGAKSLIFIAVGPLLGLVIAFGFSLLAESLDHSLRTPIEVEKYLGKPVLAVLPKMEAPKNNQQRLGGSSSTRSSLPSS